MNKKRISLVVITALIIAWSARILYANASGEQVTVSPAVIDQQVKARDILNETVTIKNDGDNKVFLYAIVDDLPVDGTKSTTSLTRRADRARSVSEWVEVTAGVIEIEPHEQVEVPITLKINLNAVPGKYYGAVAFVDASDRYAAENLYLTTNQPKLMINLDVQDQVVERAELDYFRAIKGVFLKPEAVFDLSLKNIGNVDMIPHGAIHIYDRKGKDIGELDINPDDKLVPSQEPLVFSGTWKPGTGIGRYKARLEIEYGERQPRDVQDTIYFWILPWQFLGIFVVLIIVLIVLMNMMLKKGKKNPDRDRVMPQARPTDTAQSKNRVINLRS